MGALMRAHDWSSTPLGPVESWPQSLRSALGICLNSRYPIALYWGPELALLYNDAWSPIPGAKHPWALGRPGREVWPEIWDSIGPLFERVLATGEGIWQEDELLPMRRHGYTEECYFNFTFSPIPGEGGRIDGIFNAVVETTFRVVGERRTRVLRGLAERTAGAQSAEEACRLAAEALGEASADLPFCILYLLDEENGDPLARIAAAAGIAPGGPASPTTMNVADAPWPFASVLETGRMVAVENIAEHFAAAPPGGPWPEPAERALVVPITLATRPGRPAGILVAGISPRRALDDEYRAFAERAADHIAGAIGNARAYEDERRRAEALAELDRAKTAFFTNISHELRTPLTLIAAPAEDAISDPALSEAEHARWETVRRSGLRLQKLVNTLLEFSRIEAGRVQASFEPVDLAAYTRDLASLFRSAMERAGLGFAVDAPPLPEPVYVDRDMWEKIVLNLLSNAFKHTFEGIVTVSLHAAGDHVELKVRDTGAGIPEEELPHVFDRFHRVKGARSRTHEGTGIGLALVQELVALHGGAIALESAPGVGTTATVRLPSGPRSPSAAPIPAAPPRAAGSRNASAFVEEAMRWIPEEGTPPSPLADEFPVDEAVLDGDPATSGMPQGRRARVLIADDNADMRDYLSRLLGRVWGVEAVADGAAALEAVRRHLPDLVLSDVMMPGLDGFELLRELRADPRTREIPVLLLSARAGEESRIEGMEAGADDYLVKPFSARELAAKVGAHIELARVRREAAERERKLREEAERARAEAEGAEARLREIFAKAPAIIATLRGPDYVFESANPLYLQHVGRPDILGRPVAEALPEVVEQGVIELLGRVYRTGVPFVADEMAILLDRRGDGAMDQVFINFVYQPLFDPDGAVSGILVHGVDVTDQVRARQQVEQQATELEEVQAETETINEELLRANEELSEKTREAEEANRAKSEFLASMSHELRTPLNAIAGYLDLVSLGIHGPVTDAQHVALGRIKRNQEVLLSLINDVINFAKLEAGRLEIECVEVPVGRLLEAMEPLIAPQVHARELVYRCEACAPELAGLGDPERIQQVLINLLANAVKFTRPGGRVTLSADAQGGVVHIRVSDTGRGIPAEKLEAIFDPFVQVDRRAGLVEDSQQGVGLGLAISRELARAMDGELTVESTPGAGSTFTLALPRARIPVGQTE
jgi:signal transduction histidine kinase/DNA-binding response OmpR family regulator